mmetsp:Transcript_1566/g.3838  ORF Transcript_1566/g.3838 Transcript_1566/m.3838 type:complete len:203 (+) Transcript_1566:71-679(+)|eukprot:CAMPEP_0202392074 /NCGR_PEP_ID=MMETSP1127-20130417/92177_1 /ASSEMBLY_ACC=CAM_ASM_000462 /TAXON_ID=3047 /ORGANISM="Dunaliella tertiolecta, Strain CCMP1320" /LENGTH=202 /DNA_ID=CAMNT_0048994553 /DNA_START=21 /DNA_END=629 /DNA_ORIENTATION=+
MALSQRMQSGAVLGGGARSCEGATSKALRPSFRARPFRARLLQPVRDSDGSGCATMEMVDVERLVAATSSNGSLFTPTFKAALAAALQRGHHGKDLKNILESQEEETLGDQEQILQAALRASQSNLARLQSIRANAQKLADAEARQAERLQYALNKARSDAAYYKGIEEMSEQVSWESRECKAKYAANVIMQEVERLEAMSY